MRTRRRQASSASAFPSVTPSSTGRSTACRGGLNAAIERLRDVVADPILIEVTRGAIVVTDAGGRRRAAIGDVAQAVFPRSAVKALQALPLVESGAADRFGFG